MAALRGPGGKFLSKRERAALEAESNTDTIVESNTNQATATAVPTNSNEENTVSATETTDSRYELKFVDELPKIQRKVESGVWVERLAPLRDNPGRWAQIFGPTNSPHAQVNNLRSGNAAGINPDDYEFSGRNIPTGETDEDGKPVTEGYVFARFLTDEQKVERDEKRAARAAKGEGTDEEE